MQRKENPLTFIPLFSIIMVWDINMIGKYMLCKIIHKLMPHKLFYRTFSNCTRYGLFACTYFDLSLFLFYRKHSLYRHTQTYIIGWIVVPVGTLHFVTLN